MKKMTVKMNKPSYLLLSILETGKTLMYDFSYDYIKPKYQRKAKLCYMSTDSFIIHIKIKIVYEDIVDDVEKGFDTWNYAIKKPLPIGKNKKSDWINERWIRRNDYYWVCCTLTEDLFMFNRWW